MTIVCFCFFLFKSLRWRVLESGFSLYFQSLREAYACVASAVVFCFCLFFLFFLVAMRGVCPRGDCCIFCNLFFPLLVAVRGVFSRGERYSHFLFFVFRTPPPRDKFS